MTVVFFALRDPENHFYIDGVTIDDAICLVLHQLLTILKEKKSIKSIYRRRDIPTMVLETLLPESTMKIPIRKKCKMIRVEHVDLIFENFRNKPLCPLVMWWILKCTSYKIREFSGCIDHVLDNPECSYIVPLVLESDPAGDWTFAKFFLALGVLKTSLFDPEKEHREIMRKKNPKFA
ncbi:hypothetical protein AVEN_68904-1 [Araneus ventricosus]|uniref:Uncharacterized protein n=1 Tax=Araneus ventricosus TaxID=182803 RepID=A0A4Y2TDJ1_ARAVE|nr:hypothetical protein AVEN_68904-1 [Araneus ventricosus]